MNIWIFVLGAMLGAAIEVVVMALLTHSKISDLEHRNLMSYKDGYEKGFTDGSEHKDSK
jgi:hypothetical protein